MDRENRDAASTPRSTSPTRPTPSTKKIKTISAGIVPVFIPPKDAASKKAGSSEPLFLLLRCYSYWDFPKGGVQGEETSLQAALRELEEETTLNDAKFPWGDSFRDTPVYAGGKVARYFVARVDRTNIYLPVNPLLGRPEHQEFRWVTYDQAVKLINPRVLVILDWARRLME